MKSFVKRNLRSACVLFVMLVAALILATFVTGCRSSEVATVRLEIGEEVARSQLRSMTIIQTVYGADTRQGKTVPVSTDVARGVGQGSNLAGPGATAQGNPDADQESESDQSATPRRVLVPDGWQPIDAVEEP